MDSKKSSKTEEGTENYKAVNMRLYFDERRGESKRKERHVKKCVGVNKEENTAGREGYA